MSNTLPSELDLIQQPSFGLPAFPKKEQPVFTDSAVPFQSDFLAASQRYGVPVNVIMGLAEQESSFNPKALGVPTAYGRAKGIMQYIDSTASRMGINPYDPVQSIDAAAKQLRERLDKGYTMEEAVKAHFAGDDRKQWGPKTAAYGQEVLARAEKFISGNFAAPAQTVADVSAPAQAPAFDPQTVFAELNKDEPDRYRPLTEEEMKRVSQHFTPELQQDALSKSVPGVPIEINIPDLDLTAPPAASPLDVEPKGNEDGNLLTDAGVLLLSGLNNTAQNVQELVSKIPHIGKPIVEAANRFDKWANGKDSDELFKSWEQGVKENLTPEMLEARKKAFVIEPGDKVNGKEATSYSFGPAWSDPRTYMSGILESLPEMAVTMGASGRLAVMSYKAAIKRGASKVDAAKAAARTATIAGGILEGSLAGAATSRSVREQILALDENQMKDSEALKAIMADKKMSFEEARAAIADDAAGQAFWLAGVSTGIFGGLGDRTLAKIITGDGGIVKSTVKGAIGEGLLEEMPQSIGQQMSENYAMQEADPNIPLMKGVPNAAASGLAIGGVMGAGLGAMAPRAGEPEVKNKKPADRVDPTIPQDPIPEASAPVNEGEQASTEAMAEQPTSEAATDPGEFMGPVGSDTVVVPSEDPNEKFTGKVVGYRNGMARIMDANGEIYDIEPKDVVIPSAQPIKEAEQPAAEEPAKATSDTYKAPYSAVYGKDEGDITRIVRNFADKAGITEILEKIHSEPFISPTDGTQHTRGAGNIESDFAKQFPSEHAKLKNLAKQLDVNSKELVRMILLTIDENYLDSENPVKNYMDSVARYKERANVPPTAQTTESLKAADKPLDQMNEQELRDRLKYVNSMGKQNGWDKRLTTERKIISSAIDSLKAAPVAQPAEQPADQPVKWFGSAEKANGFIQKKNLGETHEVVPVGKSRFEIREKQQADKTKSPHFQRSSKLVGPEGATLSPSMDIGQAKAGRKYVVEKIDKDGTVHLGDQVTNALIKLSRQEIEKIRPSGIKWDPVESTVAETPKAQTQSQQSAAADKAETVGAEDIPFRTVAFDEKANNGDGGKVESSGTSRVINFGGRMMVLVRIGGRKVPFYLSTGKGGKADVPDGKWYPFFGIGADGWINKTGGKDMTSYYGSEELRQKAEELDRVLGDIRNDEAVPKVAATGSHIDAINASFPNVTDNGRNDTLTKVQQSIADTVGGVAKSAPAQTQKEWQSFPEDSGTLGVPRSEMPQVKAEHRGAMVNYLNARGVAHTEQSVPADSLKPTQGEYSTVKVQKAKEYEGGNRSILVSADGYVLDGHHQWMAAKEQGQEVKVIRLDAPITDLIDMVKEFPSSTVDTASVTANQPADDNSTQVQAAASSSKAVKEAAALFNSDNDDNLTSLTNDDALNAAEAMSPGVYTPIIDRIRKHPALKGLTVFSRKMPGNAGAYSKNGHAIIFNSSVFDGVSNGIGIQDNEGESSQVLSEIIVHEYIHAVTARAIESSPEFKAELQAIQDSIKEWLKTNPKLSTSAKKALSIMAQDILEIPTYGMTDPDSQAVLRQIPSKKEGNLFNQFVTAVQKLLGLPDSSRSLLTDIIDLTDRIMAAGEPKQAAAPTADQFSGNKLFTADKVAAARERIRSKLGQLNSGIDPEMLVDGMTIAGAYIESGVRKFSEYAKLMTADLGEGVKPYLLSFWEGARNYPGLDTKGMTSAEDSAKEFAALLKPADLRTEAVGTVDKKPAARTRKTGASSDITLTNDWGVDHIDGYGENSTGAETGSDLKTQFLKETEKYLKAVADELEKAGFGSYLDVKGRPRKTVMTNPAGPAVSGDVMMSMAGPNGVGAYVSIGGTSMRGTVPVTQSGVAILYRGSSANDHSGSRYPNRWAPVDLSAADLAKLIMAEVAREEARSKPKQPEAASKAPASVKDLAVDGGSVQALVEWIAANSKNKSYQAIASRIAGQIPDGIDLMVVESGTNLRKAIPSSMNISLGALWTTYENKAVKDRTLILKGASFSENGLNEETILHELIHAATNEAINQGAKFVTEQTNPTLFNAVKELYELQNQVVDYLNKNPDYAKSIGLTFNIAASDVKELVAWGLTNEKFQEVLSKIKVAQGSLWDKFVQLVAQAIGVSRNDENALSQLLRVSGGLFDAIENKGGKTNEPKQLDEPSKGPLAGASADPVQPAESERETKGRTEGGSEQDLPGAEPAGGSGVSGTRSVGNGAGAVSVPKGRSTGPRNKSSSAEDAGSNEADARPAAGLTADELPDSAFNIDADAIGKGGAKTKYKNNVAAIRILKQLQAEGRQATRQEQEALSLYVGWGGIPQAFERTDGSASSGWDKEVKELKELLTTEEYEAAEQSTRNAHYTSPQIVSAMWRAVERMGFTGGKLIEPSVGVGNFFGLMPADIRTASALHGVELDKITAGLAANLYPEAKIANMGFQEYSIPDGYFDLAIGNPPFGAEKLYDGKRKHLSGFSIHNYFFARSIDALRPGGVLAMVVTNRFMDGTSNKAAREYIADRANLIGAIRLPNDAFSANAGTEVTTDIIFLQRREDGTPRQGASWLRVEDYKDKSGKSVPLNQYFVQNPNMMLGEFGAYGTMYRPDDSALVKREGQDTAALLEQALNTLPEKIMTATSKAKPETRATVSAQNVRVGSVYLDGDKVMIKGDEVMGESTAEVVEFPNEKAKQRVVGMIGIRDVLTDLRKLQLDPRSDAKRMNGLRKKLNQVYDDFVKGFGHINSDANKRLMRDDPTWPQLSALEDSYDKGVTAAVSKTTGEAQRAPSAKKAAIFSTRTQTPYRAPESASSAKDALIASLSETGRVNLAYMSELYNKPQDQIIQELGPLIFQDPTAGWVTRDAYLSGNVKAKLAKAKDMAATDPAYSRNVEALEAVQPKDVEAVDINIKPGASWIPANDMRAFAVHLGAEKEVTAFYDASSAKWSFPNLWAAPSAESRFGTGRMRLKSILEAAASQKAVQVYDNHHDGSRTLNETETQLANDKVNLVKEEFARWVWESDDRRTRLTRIYNDMFNTDVSRDYDGSHLTLPGKTDTITLRPHQNNAIWRIIQSGTTLTDHVVGAGKTYTLIGAAMELRRMGLANKPLFAVPNHLVSQWAADFVKLYPGANILAATKRDFEKENRKRLFARIATGDWDAVIVAHSSFGKVQVDPESESEFIREQIKDLTDSIEAIQVAEGRSSRNVKQAADRRKKLEERLKRLTDIDNKDDSLYWSELGIDALFLDEAHEFKNLAYSTSMRNVAGLGSMSGSQKSMDLFMKVRQVLKTTGGRNVVFATGTPISNTMAEMYTMQRYLDYDTLKQQGLAHFDAWARMFGEVVSDWELSPSGTYKLNSRFAKFVNMPELMQRYTSFADVINRDDINRQLAAQGKRLPVPKVKTGKPINQVVERSNDQAMYIGVPTVNENGVEVYPEGSLVYRAENLPKRAEKGSDNMLKIMSDARKAALDMRLIDPSYPDYPGSKTNVAADNIVSTYKEWHADKGTQLVFIDLSTPKASKGEEAKRIRDLIEKAENGDEAAAEELDKISPDELSALDSDFSVYDDLRQKLIDRGIPAEEIAFIHSAKTDIQKAELFAKVKSGRIRVLLGSTAKMGAGMNVQDRLVALHHLDAPWRPSDLEQREGRIIRQGNTFYDRDPEGFEVGIYRYATKQTLDSRMWQTLESKARFIEQVRKGNTAEREVEDIGGEAANSAEMKAASSGNPLILEEMSLRQQIRKLENERQGFARDQHRIRDRIRFDTDYMQTLGRRIAELESDQKLKIPESFAVKIEGVTYTKRADAGAALLAVAADMERNSNSEREIGKYGDFTIHMERTAAEQFLLHVTGSGSYTAKMSIGDDPQGLSMRLTNTVSDLGAALRRAKENKDELEADVPKLQKQLSTWGKIEELEKAKGRHAEVLDQLKPKKAEKSDKAEEPKTPPKEEVRFSAKMQTETAAFKRWFGDSKNVDEDGEPIIFYHGGRKGFTEVKGNQGRWTGSIFVTEGQPSGYGAETYPLYLKAEILELNQLEKLLNSKDGESALRAAVNDELSDDDVELLIESLTDGSHYPTDDRVLEILSAMDEADAQVEIQKLRGDLAKRLGYGAVRTPDEFDGLTVMVVDGSQIKSATSNTGTFDPTNPDIRYGMSAEQVSSTPSEGMLLDQVQAIANKIVSEFTGDMPLRMIITQTQDELYGPAAREQGIYIKGAYHPERNAFTLIADNLDNPRDVRKTIIHEFMAHYGLDTFDAESRQELLQKVIDSRGTKDKPGTLWPMWEKISTDPFYGQKSEIIQAEEVFAHTAESMGGKFQQFFDSIRGLIIKGLRKLGLIKSPLTNTEIRQVIRSIAQGIRNGSRSKQSQFDEVKFSQAPQIGTEAFKRWFGDSKVVDESGKPLVVYHGTFLGEAIAAFDLEKGNGMVWTTSQPSYASEFTGRASGAVYPLYMSIKKPFDASKFTGEKSIKYWKQKLQAAGVDVSKIDWSIVDFSPEYGKYNFYDLFPHAGNNEAKSGALEAIQAAGFDGLIAPAEEGMSKKSGFNYVAFSPTQIKSATGNDGTFDPTNPDIRFSQRPSNKEVDSWIAQKWEATKELTGDALTTALPTILRWWPGRPLLIRVGKEMPALAHYADIKLKMDTFRDDWHAITDKLAQRWQKYRILNSKENSELMDLMHESTLRQVDPSKPFMSLVTEVDEKVLAEHKPGTEAYDAAAERATQDAERQVSYDELKARFDKLSREGKNIYHRVRDTYKKLADTQEQIVLDNIERALGYKLREAQRKHEEELQRIKDEGLKGSEKDEAIEKADKALANAARMDAWNKRAKMNQFRSEFESNRLAGPYFPLSRFGDFFVTARDKDTGEVEFFSRQESARDQTRVAKELKQRGYDVETGYISKSADLRKQIPAEFVATIEELLKGVPGTEETQDQVWQMFLERMPDISIRKNRIHRKGRAGFEEDALRAFASHMFHGAHQTAKLKYSMALEDQLDEAKRQVKNTRNPTRNGMVLEQVNKNHQYVMNPTSNAVSQVATQGAFIWYLATSPAAALLNMGQTVIVGPPKLAAFYDKGTAQGIAMAIGQINRALFDLANGKTFAENSPRVTPEEKAAVAQAYRVGLITRTQSHDVAGIADSGIKYSPIRAKIMAGVSWMFHHTERVNREATFLAAYRVAKKKGLQGDNAIHKAMGLTWDIHYDYQNTSRPAIMHSNTGKALLVFRNYSLNMIADLVSTTYEIINPRNPQERREARTQMIGLLGTLAFNAGIRGLPLYGIMMVIAGMFSDDGEDPEIELKKSLLEYLPPSMVGMMMDGVPGYTLGVEISSRIGFGDLWFRSDNMDKEGDSEYLSWLQQVLGAASSIPYNIYKGINQISDGYTWRGMENILPKMIKDPMKSWRYVQEGVTTKHGDPIVDEVGGWDIFKQAIGVTPARIAEQHKMNSYNMNKQKKILDQRSKLLADFYKAWKAEDSDKQQAVLAKMDEYTKEYPEMAIDSDSIRQSLKRREKYRGQNIGGMNYNQNLLPRLQGEQPGTVYR